MRKYNLKSQPSPGVNNHRLIAFKKLFYCAILYILGKSLISFALQSEMDLK